MVKNIDDFNGSQPTNASGGLNRPIPASPSSILLAEFGLGVFTSATNKIQLEVAVEWQSTLGTPQILFQVIRGTGIIYTVQAQTVAVLETRNTAFTVLELNVPLGYYAYKLNVQQINSTLTNSATVIGPVTFTGITIV